MTMLRVDVLGQTARGGSGLYRHGIYASPLPNSERPAQMQQFLASSFFNIVGLPILTATATIFIKYISQNDKFSKFRREDLAIGFELLIVAVITQFLGTVELVRARGMVSADDDSINDSSAEQMRALFAKQEAISSEIIDGLLIIAALLLATLLLSTYIRKWGWISGSNPSLRVSSISVQLVIGVLGLILVLRGAN